MPGLQYSAKGTWNGERLTGAVKDAARRGTRRAAERLRALSVPLAPLDQGPLRESAAVKGVNAEPIALVVYDTPYAVRQHEELDYQHTDGQAKYLEQPLTDNSAELMAIIVKEVRVGILNA